MMESTNKDTGIIDSITDFSGAAAGSAVGAAIGAAVIGPIGAVGGSIAGSAIEQAIKLIGKEIKERILSKAEERKIGTVYSVASELISKKLDRGQELRDDDFFDINNNRSAAEEILEGTVFAAQRESEEKKIPYYAKLYANIAFDSTISKPIANQLIKLTEQLTYRQIVILHVIGRFMAQATVDSSLLKKSAYAYVSGLTNVTIASEIFELYRMSILSSRTVIFDCAGVNPYDLRIAGYGGLLFNLMELSSLEDDPELATLTAEIAGFLTEGKSMSVPSVPHSLPKH